MRAATLKSLISPESKWNCSLKYTLAKLSPNRDTPLFDSAILLAFGLLPQKNGVSPVFDYEAFERILGEGLDRYPCRILSYQLMPNHWHFILQPTEDGGMSNFLRWVTLTHAGV